MTSRINAALPALAASLLVAVFASPVSAFSERVQNNCKDDYLNFCSAHPIGSTGMRRCMEANGKNLTSKCVNALVDAGEIPRKFARKQ
jgi:hypothetical protein